MKSLKRLFATADKPAPSVVAEKQPAAPAKPPVTVTVKRRRLAIFEPPPPEIAKKIAAAKGNQPGRECSTCEIGTNCPEFEDGSACAYTGEFEAFGTRSKADLSVVIHNVFETNVERYQFAKFAEKRVHGGAPTPEVTRLGREVLEQANMLLALDEQEASMTIGSDGDDAGGILASLFGDGPEEIEVNPPPELPEPNPVVNPVVDVEGEEVPL